MGGVTKMEPKGGSGVFGNKGLAGRVGDLERRMTAVETGMITVAGDAAKAALSAAQAAEGVKELLGVANATKSVAGFVRKHGPKLISFGAGIMTILGVGNPELWKFVGHFFGQ